MSIKRRLCVVGLAACSLSFAADAPKGEPAGSSGASAAELQKQLIATAAEGQRLAEEANRAGVGSTEETFAWVRRLSEARMRAATTKEQRIEILTDAVRMAKAQEAHAQAAFGTGSIRASEPLAARYHRIEAELALAAEQVK
jgi:hypothetical protein